MTLKMWGKRLALGAIFVFTLLACRTSDVLVAQNQPTPTRVVRPTFTHAPPTATPTPTATRTRTRVPTARPTARPPTVPPPTGAPPPTAPPYKYKAVNVACYHSGQAFVQGTVYEGNSPVNGKMVVMSFAEDGPIADRRESGTDGDGFYSMIVNAFGAAPGQTRYVWVDEGGRRVSTTGRINFNNLKPEDHNACWRGVVDFQLWELVR